MAKKKTNKPDDQLPTDQVDGEQASEPNLDETVRIDTVNMNDLPKVDPNQQTIAEDEIEQTVQVDPSDSSSSQNITVRRGADSAATKRIDKAEVDRLQETTVELTGGGIDQTLPDDHSFLASSDIGQTVNPRELSNADVTIWNSAVGESNQSTEVNPTEIEESYAERQLERLRTVNVSALKSSSDATSDYRLVRKLGQGGMGDVFVARQGSLDRLLALKLIKPLSEQKRDQLEKTGRLDSVVTASGGGVVGSAVGSVCFAWQAPSESAARTIQMERLRLPVERVKEACKMFIINLPAELALSQGPDYTAKPSDHQKSSGEPECWQ